MRGRAAPSIGPDLAARPPLNTPYQLLPDALPAHRAALLALWSAHSALGVRADAKLALAYDANPFGPGHCLLLHRGDPGQPVGALGLHRRRYHDGAQRRDALVLADFVVDPLHRTLGPALSLMRGALDVALGEAPWVLGVPNPASRAVLRRAGLDEVTALSRRGKLLRSAYGLKRHGLTGAPAAVTAPLDGALRAVDRVLGRPARWRWRDTAFSDPDLAEVWARRPAGLCLGERSPEALCWRFGTRADGATAAWRLSLACGDDGAAIGYVVWRVQDDLAEVADFLCADPLRELSGLLLGFARHCRHSCPASALTLECAGPPALQQQLTRAGFLATGLQGVLGLAATGAPTWPANRLFMTTFDRDPDV